MDGSLLINSSKISVKNKNKNEPDTDSTKLGKSNRLKKSSIFDFRRINKHGKMDFPHFKEWAEMHQKKHEHFWVFKVVGGRNFPFDNESEGKNDE